MCGACGIFNSGQDWTEGFGTGSGGGDLPPHERLAERRRRMALVNELLAPTGVSLREQGRQLILKGPTGATAVVTDLAHVWRKADELGRGLADPLQPGTRGATQ